MNGQRILRIVAVWAGISLFPPAPASAHPEFVGGHVFVSVTSPDPCDFGGLEAIVEIDPTTGTVSVFAGSDDGICLVNGLRFTPDGTRLLHLNFGHILPVFDGGWVQAFNPDGTSEVILDASDALARPFGANALAIDASGDLYVLNSLTSTILRFPADGGPGSVFADSTDGILGRGALDFAPNGDLFYGGDLADAIIRITPQGESSVFDNTLRPYSLAFDRRGNLFVEAAVAGRAIYRYDHADPNSRRVLASGFLGASGIAGPLTLAPDGSVVYYAALGGTLYTIDAEDGTTTVLHDLSDSFAGFPMGITVYVPEPPAPAISEWGNIFLLLLILTTGTLVLLCRRISSPARSDVTPFFERESKP